MIVNHRYFIPSPIVSRLGGRDGIAENVLRSRGGSGSRSFVSNRVGSGNGERGMIGWLRLDCGSGSR